MYCITHGGISSHLACAIAKCCQHCDDSREWHWTFAKRVFRTYVDLMILGYCFGKEIPEVELKDTVTNNEMDASNHSSL